MNRKISGYFYIKKLIDALLYATIIWVALFLIFYDSAIVYDISMQPTLNAKSGVSDNDMVYSRKWADYEIGDIVVVFHQQYFIFIVVHPYRPPWSGKR